ncbi:MAG: pyridoxal phosphate-dependent aminotransferase [Bacteroidales bacterium]|nr:pyridoxal phosphate-dependent aminotransferase [Bacteroidales bacterium]
MSGTNENITGSLISYFSNLVKSKGGINLAQGIPGFNPPKKLLDSLKISADLNCHQYAPGLGNLNLRKYIQNSYPHIDKDSSLFITNGATEAISLIYTYLKNKNSELNVLAFSPAYESYIHLPKIFGDKYKSIQCYKDKYFDKDELVFAVDNHKINTIFIASPGNPYGKIMTKEEFDFLGNLCAERQIYLIIDAVYSELYFSTNKPYYPINNINPYVFYVNSFSKKLSITGWRIGYFFCHESHKEKIAYIHDYIGLSTPAPLQGALSSYLQLGEANLYINNLRQLVKLNLDFALLKLNNNGFNCFPTDGGYFIWTELPVGFDDGLDFGLKLYQNHKTAIIPGEHFGKEWKRFIRINIARTKDEFENGIIQILSFIKNS